MKVKELIEILKQQKDDADIILDISKFSNHIAELSSIDVSDVSVDMLDRIILEVYSE